MTDNATLDTVSKITNAAANHDDRWMLIAAIVIIILACLALMRWMIGERAELGKRLTEITDRHIQQGERLGELVANNTEALRRSSDVLGQVADVIRACPGAVARPPGNTEFVRRQVA